MAVRQRTRNNVAYGLDNPLQTLAPEPIISSRNPTTSDTAELATLWINKVTQAYFVLTSVSAGVATWQAQATGSGVFASVSVTGAVGDVLTVANGGDTVLGGDLTVAGTTTMTGDLTVNGDLTANGDFDIASANAISFSSTANLDPSVSFSTNGGTTETIQINCLQGTAVDSIQLLSTAGGVLVQATNLANTDAINLVAPAGGVTIDAVLTSAINVVGAGADIQLNATGGSIAATATESTPGAVTISASGVAGTVLVSGTGGVGITGINNTVSIQSGTGAMNISTAAAANAITIGNSTGGTAVTINSGTGAINIGTNAIAHQITIGNGTGATGVFLDSGSQGVNIATNAVTQVVSIGNVTAGSAVDIYTPAGTPVGVNSGININGPVIISGAGSPNGVVTAAISSLYLRTDASSAVTRIYVNTDGAMAWTNITCAG